MTKNQCIEYTKENLPKMGWLQKSKYLGNINNNRFKITINSSTNSYYKQNAFRPINIGTIEENDGEAMICVKQRMSIPVIIFSTIACLFSLFIMGMISLKAAYEKDYSLIPCLIVPLIIVLVIVVSWICGLKMFAQKDMEEIKKFYMKNKNEIK